MTSRRDFLKASGALIVSFSAWEFPSAQNARAAASQVDAWLAIGSDGFVAAYTGKCELGQGLHTAQVQLIAEELSVPVDRVRLVMCDTSLTPDQGTTSGSQSHPTNFNNANLARAAATARNALLTLASYRFGVAPNQLTLSGGAVSVTSDRSKSVSLGELVRGRPFDLPLNTTASRKPASEWTVLGTSVPRLDLPALVTARLEFVQDVRVPGMVHGRVIRPPGPGATLLSVDETSVAGMPGLIKVVVRASFVGVVAEKPWQAVQAAARLKASWTRGPALPSQREFYDYLRKQPSRDTLIVDSGDVDQKLTGRGTVLKATYFHPYQMHGSMGTSVAVADVHADRATIWSSTQSAYPLRSGTAAVLGFRPENVRVIFTRGSGCYGINGADTVAYDAALMSQAVGRPVRVQLSRQDEMAWENYGFAYVIDQRAVVDADGYIAAWDHEAWYPALGGRPGYDTPGNVVTGTLAGFQPAPFAPRSPAPPPTSFNNGSNAAPSYVAGCAGGRCGGTGTIKSERVLTHMSRSRFFTGPLRSPSRLQNTFAHESFIDEIAAHLNADPVEYRLRHLHDRRLIAVVKAAATAANWQKTQKRGLSPLSQKLRTGVASGRGFACCLYEGDNGYCALVADVDVDQNTGRLAVKRLIASQDCGSISNPDGMKNQIEGGALQGLSRALGEEVTWDDTHVTSVDWRSYHSLTLGAEVPEIESVLINRPGEAAMGAGETTITIVAAAVANAIFDATGARIREIPLTPARVKAALDARS